MDYKAKILLVDDDKFILKALHQGLSTDYQVDSCLSAEDAIAMLENHQQFDAIIIDINLPGINGPDLIKFLKDNYPLVKRFVLSGLGEDEIMSNLNINDAVGVFYKPWNTEQILSSIHNALN